MNVRNLIFVVVFFYFFTFANPLISQFVIFNKPLSSRIANYKISVKLDPEMKIVEGHELLTWRNDSRDLINELQFHLYLNAFKNSETTFMKEGGHRGRKFKFKEEAWGYLDVNSLSIVEGPDLTNSIEFIQPDDNNPEDQTVIRVPLPKPLLPNETIKLSINFTSKLPQVFTRTGYWDDFFLIAQWFPKIGVYTNGAWNCHQFHANSEFFADYGVYDVEITVPQEYVVGATGSRVDSVDNADGTKTLTYHAEDVHDFAWTADPDFRIFSDQWRHVKIMFYAQPDHFQQAKRHLEAAKIALKFYSEWYGKYPYPTLTIVDPAPGAEGASGMEYPTFIVAGFTHWLLPKGIRIVEMVVIHEFGHNYFYGLLGSNEFEEPWLDEGINSYAETRVMKYAFGEKGNWLDIAGIKLSDLEFQKLQYFAGTKLDPIVRKAWEFYSGASYTVNSYAKPVLVLTTLENYLGEKTMNKIMKTYCERWKFKHPTTQDFIDVVNEVSDQDLNWYFNQTLYGSNELDYAVTYVRSRVLHESQGIGVEAQEEKEISTNDKSAKSDIKKDSVEMKKKEKLYENEVRIRCLGGVIFPVEVLIKFKNGEEIREQWDGHGRWVKYKYVKPTQIEFAQIDPENKVVLDVNTLNNSRTLKRLAKGVNKLSLRWLFWMQNILHLFTTL